jgi:hypothetical protein
MRINSKKSLLLVICCVFIAMSNLTVNSKDVVTESPKVKISMDGVIINYDNVPITVNGRTLLPLKEFLISIGIPDDNEHIIWNGLEKSVTINKDSTEVYLEIGNYNAIINNSVVVLDAAPCIYKNRTYIPVRFVSQCFNKNVSWDSETSTVNITSNIVNQKDTSNMVAIPDSWIEKEDMPFQLETGSYTMDNEGRGGFNLKWTEYSNIKGKSVTVGDKIYVVNIDGRVAEYNPKFDTWAEIGIIPNLENSHGFYKLVSVNNMIYIVGKDFNEIVMYNPANNETKLITTLPTKRIVGGAVAVNNKIYILAGIDLNQVNTLNTLDEYDLETNKWTTKANLLSPINRLSVSALNGKIYTLCYGPTLDTGIREYNIEKDCWTEKSALSSIGFMGADLTAVNGRVYILGKGKNLGSNKSVLHIEEYNTELDKCNKLTSSRSTGKEEIIVQACNGKIYVIGNSSLRALQEYTPPNP